MAFHFIASLSAIVPATNAKSNSWNDERFISTI